MRALAVYSSLLLKLETIRNFLNFKHTRQPDVCYDFIIFLFVLLLFPLPISMMLTYSQIRVQAIFFPSVVLSYDRTTVRWKLQPSTYLLQVNLFQKRLFLHQLTHNRTTDCSLIIDFSTRKIQAQNMLCTKIVLNAKTKTKKQCMYTTCPELVVFV